MPHMTEDFEGCVEVKTRAFHDPVHCPHDNSNDYADFIVGLVVAVFACIVIANLAYHVWTVR